MDSGGVKSSKFFHSDPKYLGTNVRSLAINLGFPGIPLVKRQGMLLGKVIHIVGQPQDAGRVLVSLPSSGQPYQSQSEMSNFSSKV